MIQLTGLANHPRSEWQLSIICEGNSMEVQPDFREPLALLNAHEVEYIIVGAYALAFHGAPRFTADLEALGED